MQWWLLLTLATVLFGVPSNSSSNLKWRGEEDASSKVIPAIANGKFARPAQFPYIAAIFRAKASAAHCGASLVSPWAVLTAAHCVYNDFGSAKLPNTVVIGAPDLRTASSVKRRVVKSYVHPDFDYFNVSSTDVALLQLDKRVRGVPIANLAGPNQRLAKREKLWVAGFGETEMQQASEKLRYTTLSRVPLKRCQRYYGQVDVPIPPYMMCAGSKKTSDFCFGDSGGPLVTRGKKSVQVGVAAFGQPDCGVRGSIGVYTSISAVRSWIDSQLPGINRRARRRWKRQMRRRRRSRARNVRRS